MTRTPVTFTVDDGTVDATNHGVSFLPDLGSDGLVLGGLLVIVAGATSFPRAVERTPNALKQ